MRWLRAWLREERELFREWRCIVFTHLWVYPDGDPEPDHGLIRVCARCEQRSGCYWSEDPATPGWRWSRPA